MYKHKPHKGLKKRVKISARGKVVRRMSFRGHLLSGKSGRRRLRLRRPALITGKLAANIKRALGEH